MCVIINREPNVEISFDKIKSACTVNPHGFGLMFAEDGKLTIIRQFDEKGNDPEEVARLLETYKDHQVSLHLRFMTIGEKSSDNCHPYVTCTKDDDLIDVAFMHNGTLSDFRRDNSRMSDSYHFNEEIVRPLFLRFAHFDPEEPVLKDPLFQSILGKYCGTTSVFNLMDGEGNILVINESRGVKYEGWWASNDYSFNRFHREPDTNGYSSNSNWHYNGRYYERDYTYPKTNNTVKALPSNVVKEVPEIEPPVSRETFIEVAKISSLEEVIKLNEEDIEELIEVYPEYAKLLIQDLILALYNQESDNVTTPSRLAANG
jgi:hypothetical protein